MPRLLVVLLPPLMVWILALTINPLSRMSAVGIPVVVGLVVQNSSPEFSTPREESASPPPTAVFDTFVKLEKMSTAG